MPFSGNLGESTQHRVSFFICERWDAFSIHNMLCLVEACIPNYCHRPCVCCLRFSCYRLPVALQFRYRNSGYLWMQLFIFRFQKHQEFHPKSVLRISLQHPSLSLPSHMHKSAWERQSYLLFTLPSFHISNILCSSCVHSVCGKWFFFFFTTGKVAVGLQVWAAEVQTGKIGQRDSGHRFDC